MKFLFLVVCILVTILVENASSRSQSSSAPGSYTPISADDDDVKQLALFSLNTVAQQSGSQRSLGLVRVISAKYQVVAGTNYMIQLLACEKNSGSTNEKNSVLDQKSCRTCDVTIWEQMWLNKKTVNDVACSKPAELASFSNVANNN